MKILGRFRSPVLTTTQRDAIAQAQLLNGMEIFNKTKGYKEINIAADAAVANWQPVSPIAVTPLLTLVCDLRLAADQASFDTNTILGGNIAGNPGDTLLFEFEGRATGATAILYLRCNNDSGTNYDSVNIISSNGASAAYQTLGNAGMMLETGQGWFNSAMAANYAASVSGMLYNYAGVDFYKSFKDNFEFPNFDGAGTHKSGAGAHVWKNTAAITRLQLVPSVGNIKAGSRLTIWRKAVA